MKKVLMLDNYDSFSYILVGYINDLLGYEIDVKRNDEISIDEIDQYDIIFLSPGPGLPKDAGIMPQLLETYSLTKRIMGICLGHQAIIESFGGSIQNLDKVFHGVASEITSLTKDSILFDGIPEVFKAGRYHSWCASANNVSNELIITAMDASQAVMAVKHKSYPIFGVQFHPESIMTPYGKKMIANFLEVEYNELPLQLNL